MDIINVDGFLDVRENYLSICWIDLLTYDSVGSLEADVFDLEASLIVLVRVEELQLAGKTLHIV